MVSFAPVACPLTCPHSDDARDGTKKTLLIRLQALKRLHRNRGDRPNGVDVESSKEEPAKASDEAEESELEPDPRPAPPGVERRRGPSTLDSLVSWAEKQLEGPPPPSDPGDAMVRCWVGPHEHFTTKRDCESRGGRGYDLPPEN